MCLWLIKLIKSWLLPQVQLALEILLPNPNLKFSRQALRRTNIESVSGLAEIIQVLMSFSY